MCRKPAIYASILTVLISIPPAAWADEPVNFVRAVLEARSEKPVEARGPVWDERVEREAGTAEAGGSQLFFMTGPDNSPCVRSVPDVTGDGRDEVLVGIDESGTDNIFLLDGGSSGAATVVWSVETMDGVSGGSPWGDQSLERASDLDGNGHGNILAGTAWGGRTAYNLDALDGTVHWKFDTYLTPDSGWVYSLAEMSDVTGDGVAEVVFGAGSDNDAVYMLDGASSGQATVRWRFLALDGVLSVRNAGDLNGDGDDDALAAVGDFGERLVALDGGTLSSTGSILWQYTPGVTVYAAGSLPDVTGDDVDEALAVLWTLGGSAVRALNGATGALVWSSTDVFDFGTMVDLLGDVTGDGVPEVVVSSFENAVTVLDGADGTLVWKSFVGTLNGGDLWTARSIGDLNGDGREDVIAGSFDYHVYAFDGDDGTELWSYDTGNRVFSVAPVGDLDGDGRPEVAVGTQDTNNNVVALVLSGGAAEEIFTDGFESGGTTAWTLEVAEP